MTEAAHQEKLALYAHFKGKRVWLHRESMLIVWSLKERLARKKRPASVLREWSQADWKSKASGRD